MNQQNFFHWTAVPFPTEEYTARRASLYAALAPAGGVLLIPGTHHFSDGFTFRQLDDFLYFCGLELPDSVLALAVDKGEAHLFVPERDPRFDSPTRPNDFPGRLLASDPALAERSGVDTVRPMLEFEPYLRSLSRAGQPVWVNPGRGGLNRPDSHNFFRPLSTDEVFRQQLLRAAPGLALNDAYPHIARLHMVKSAAEIGTIRTACNIGMAGIRVAAAAIRPGVTERDLEAVLESEYKRLGAQRLPFASIIKSGPNTLWPWRILASHYDRRNRAVQAGELVVFDVGCEYNYYGSDMGRTFPATGRFTNEQATILAMQLNVLDTMIAAMKPGTTLAEVQAEADRAIPEAARQYMQGRPFFGHHIGLSMGDPSLFEAPLQPGMVITLEPWYYNHDRQIGTFIEDVILVTESGCENLTAALARTPAGMAALVSS